MQAQFRYAYVCDADGIKVLDITRLDRPVPVSKLEMGDAHNIYLARTYAYVAGGPAGLVILDIEKPEQPRIDWFAVEVDYADNTAHSGPDSTIINR